MYKHSHGYTLIELLTVIAIISILASMLFSAFAAAREQSRQISCASNMRQLGIAFSMYETDNDDRLPNAWDGDNGIDTDDAYTGGWIYYNQFAQNSPDTQDFFPDKGSIYPYVQNKGVYVCPDDSRGQTVGDSYALNQCVVTPSPTLVNFHTGKLLAKLPNESGMMLLTEETVWFGFSTTNDGFLSLSFPDVISDRHSSGSNVAFVDNHVKWYHTDQIHAHGLQTGLTTEIAGVTPCPS
jgi:prepilin-type N-terminal cleavage/methylation domain-containing protein/prepilin-type processing-associated H-X9-DG protein